MNREWLFRPGRLDAVDHVALFIAETEARLRAVGLSDGNTYLLPITQADVSEVTGITDIHVNRVLRVPREEEICVFRFGRIGIFNRAGLERTGYFDPTYLSLKKNHADLRDHIVPRRVPQ